MRYAAVIALAACLWSCQRAEARHNRAVRAAPAPGASILFFELDTCPDGWERFDEAQGRVIVGLSELGELGAQVGTALTPSGAVTISTPPEHSHSVDAPSTGTGSDSHNHSFDSRDPHDADGADSEIADGTNQGGNSVPTSTNQHSHSVTFPGFNSAASGDAAVDVTMPYLQLTACSRAGIVVAPPGAIAFFYADSCPADWSAVASARGRVIVAAPQGANIGATKGEALADKGDRTISSVPAHTHQVDPPQVIVSDNTHDHTFDSQTVHDDNGGSGDAVQEANTVYTTPTVGNDSHSHSVNPAAVTSSAAGDKEVAVTMPYVQVLVCERNQ